jgi:hypothetical protein
LIEIRREFGIQLIFTPVIPEELISDNVPDLSYLEKVDALAEWCMHNERGMVPLVAFNGHKIESETDLYRLLQEG